MIVVNTFCASMRKQKTFKLCDLPFKDTKLNVLILNASLKHAKEGSNTGELADLVVGKMRDFADVKSVHIRLSDKDIPVGLGYKETETDEWPSIVEEIKKADIVLFATPIWWSGHSSLMQRVIERFDAFDEDYLLTSESVIYNKVAGIVITGHEDGALATMGTLMKALTWFGFTLPPECGAYWVGEVGFPSDHDAEKRRANESTTTMAARLARNLVYYAQLLKKYPLTQTNVGKLID